MDQKDLIRIIFLDIDGVVNSHRKTKEVYELTHKPHSNFNTPFDERCMQVLKEIVELTDSYIVITSTWRKFAEGRKKLVEAFKEYDLDYRIIGYTPVLNKLRSEEIKAFLSSLTIPVTYVIIDDDSDMEELMDHLVKTDIKVGLTEEQKETIIKKITK